MSMLTRREKLLAFAGILIVLFLASLNLTVVGTALPRVIAELDGFDLYAWAFTAFAITSTITLPIYGRLSDIYGRKRITLLGIVLFSIGSALCGLAQSMIELVVFRAVQGLGGGALIGMTWSLLGDIFTARERGKYQGFTGAVFAISAVIGPIVGGLITDTLGWRWVFFVNLPVALLAFAFIARTIPPTQQLKRSSVDYAGTLLLTAGITPLLLAFTWGGVEHSWSSPVILVLIGASVLLLGAFAVWQFKAPAPILDPELFRDPTFNVANVAGFLTAVGLFGAVIFLPLYVQGVQGGSAAASGFVLTPLMLGIVVSGSISGILVSRTGRYKPYIVAGVIIMIAAFYLTSGLGPETPLWLATAYMILLGIGIGPTNALFVLAVQNAQPLERLGSVTGATIFFRQIGGTLGVALFGGVIVAALRKHLGSELPGELERLPPHLLEDLASPNLLTNPAALARAQQEFAGVVEPPVFAALIDGLRSALSDGLSVVFLLAAAISGLALMATWLLPPLELRDERAPAAPIGSQRDAAGEGE